MFLFTIFSKEFFVMLPATPVIALGIAYVSSAI